MRQAFAAVGRMGEDVANRGHTLLRRNHLHAAHGDQFAAAADAPEQAGRQLKRGEGDAASVAGSIEPLDLRQVRAGERFRGAAA